MRSRDLFQWQSHLTLYLQSGGGNRRLEEGPTLAAEPQNILRSNGIPSLFDTHALEFPATPIFQPPTRQNPEHIQM